MGGMSGRITEQRPKTRHASAPASDSSVQRAVTPVKGAPPRHWSGISDTPVEHPDRIRSPRPTTAVLQGFFGGGKNGKMDDQEFSQALFAHPDHGKLTGDMLAHVHKRHKHLKKYELNHTIRDLLSGTIKPPVPAPGGVKPRKRREAAGYINPAHTDPIVQEIFERAVHTPPPSNRPLRDFLFSPNRNFWVHTPTHTSKPKLVKGHGKTVLGHGPVDAVVDFNAVGHKRLRAANKAHNRDPKIYHGLEDKYASAKSGGKTKTRYRSPNQASGSHPSYYRRDDPDFDDRVPWTTYANQADVMAGIPYVPPAFGAAPPQGPAVVKPVPMAMSHMAPAPAPNHQPSAPPFAWNVGAPTANHGAFAPLPPAQQQPPVMFANPQGAWQPHANPHAFHAFHAFQPAQQPPPAVLPPANNNANPGPWPVAMQPAIHQQAFLGFDPMEESDE